MRISIDDGVLSIEMSRCERAVAAHPGQLNVPVRASNGPIRDGHATDGASLGARHLLPRPGQGGDLLLEGPQGVLARLALAGARHHRAVGRLVYRDRARPPGRRRVYGYHPASRFRTWLE